MAEVTNKELRIAREAQKLTRWQVAEQVGVSEYTIERWENGESMPSPDDVDRLEKLCKADGLWIGWMRSHYESCRKRLPEYKGRSKLESIVNVRHEMDDVMRLQDRAERSMLSDQDKSSTDSYYKELKDLLKAIMSAIPK